MCLGSPERQRFLARKVLEYINCGLSVERKWVPLPGVFALAIKRWALKSSIASIIKWVGNLTEALDLLIQYEEVFSWSPSLFTLLPWECWRGQNHLSKPRELSHSSKYHPAAYVTLSFCTLSRQSWPAFESGH